MGNMVVNPIAFFTDLLGRPLQKGSVYVGVASTNPVTNPVTVYQDAAMTIPMQQPLTTTNGCVSLNGSPQPFYVNAASFSLLVNDQNGNLVLSIANYTNQFANQVGAGGAAQIGFDGTTLDQQFLGRVNRVVDSIAALRALSHSTYTRVFVTGYYTAHDGGGGAYQYDPNDTTSADNGGTVIVAADGGRWKLQLTGPVSAKQFGARGNGTAGQNVGNDDTTALQNWLSALSPTLSGYLSAGVYNTSATLTRVASSISINTDGAANTIINWIGAAGATDLMTLGDGTTICAFWRVGGLGFESAVRMTGGAALHLKKFMTRNDFEEVACGVVSNNGNLYHGAWLDLVNVFYLPSIDATKLQGDGLRFNGSATDDSGSDIFLARGNISFCAVGVRQGGGMGGLRTGQVNSFNNGTNWRVDTTIVARKNREFFYELGSVCDGASGEAGIVFDDALTSNAPVILAGFIGSSGQLSGTTGPWHGIWIKNWPNGRISVLSGDVFNCKGNGIQKDDQSCILTIAPTTRIFNNTGYGVSALNADQNIYYFGGYVALNTAGNWNANAQLANGDTYTPTVTAQTGALGAYTATMRWSKLGKIVTFTAYVTITTNGTAAGSLNIALPFTTRLAVAVMGKELASGKSLAGYINSNSSVEGVTFYDGTYPGANGATLILSGTCEVQ